jgi:N-acetylornithine carbamoyltransferase
VRRFLSLAELPREEVLDLLALATRLEQEPEPQALAGRILALLFFNPSLRTLASFQAGMARLGGSSFVISPGQGSWQLETRQGVVMSGEAAEHVREAVPVLASYADALGIRAFAGGRDLAADLADTTFRAMAAVCPVPLINLESAIDHPCQALADWKTLDDLAVPRHGRFVLSWACHPKPLPLAVPAAALHMAALRGMEVVVARPHGYGLPEPVMARARAAAELSGGSVRETVDPGEAMQGARVVYAKSWGSPEIYGDAQAEAIRRRALGGWCVDEHWFDEAAPDCRFMHCLPVRRNVVVTDAVLDGPRSVVVQEARNRMWVQMAILHRLLVGAPRGETGRAGAGPAPTPDLREAEVPVDSVASGVGAGPAPARPGLSEDHE